MAVDVTARTTIRRPVTQVAAYAGDPVNAPKWYRRIASAEWVRGPGPDGPQVGDQVRFRARFMGRNLDYVYEITELVPGERVTMRTSQGPFPMTTEYSWAPAGGGTTEMSIRNHGEPSGFSLLVAPMLSLSMRRAMSQDLATLKRQLEGT